MNYVQCQHTQIALELQKQDENHNENQTKNLLFDDKPSLTYGVEYSNFTRHCKLLIAIISNKKP